MTGHLKRLGLPAALLLLTTHAAAQTAPASEPAQTAPAHSEPAQAAPPHSESAPAGGVVQHPWWVAAELHMSFLSNLVEKSTVNLTYGYGAKSGYRWKTDWGVYFQLEHNLWLETEMDVTTQQGVFNIGVGAERLYFARRMRAALAIGPSILLYDTALDDAGTTGLFIDVRPTGVRWPVGKGWALVFDPLTFTLEIPALSGIPLLQIQYRTVLAVEYGLGR